MNEGSVVVEVRHHTICCSVHPVIQGTSVDASVTGLGVSLQSDILGYGGDGLGEERPSFIPKAKWSLLADYSSKQADEMQDFVPVELDITCDNGKDIKRPEETPDGGRLLQLPTSEHRWLHAQRYWCATKFLSLTRYCVFL